MADHEDELAHLLKLRDINKSRRRKLELQEAREGTSVDPKVLLEMEDLEREIRDLEDQIAAKRDTPIPESTGVSEAENTASRLRRARQKLLSLENQLAEVNRKIKRSNAEEDDTALKSERLVLRQEIDEVLEEKEFLEEKDSVEKDLAVVINERSLQKTLLVAESLLVKLYRSRDNTDYNQRLFSDMRGDARHYFNLILDHEEILLKDDEKARCWLGMAKIHIDFDNNPIAAMDCCNKSINLNQQYEEAFWVQIRIYQALSTDTLYKNKVKTGIKQSKKKMREIQQASLIREILLEE